jgi:formylglycine-generating enzyme required for sulfatase activity
MRALRTLLLALVACGSASGRGEVSGSVRVQGSGTVRGVAEKPACPSATDALTPLVVEWPATDRATIDSLAQRGPVVVRYENCKIDPMPACRAPGEYAYAPVNRKRQIDDVTTAFDLYAKLPVGAGRLESTLRERGALRVVSVIVGVRASSRPRVAQAELTGECAGATHVLRAMTLGAFRFFAGADARATTDIGIGGFGSSSSATLLQSDGQIPACDRSLASDRAPPKECGALTRLDLEPIGSPAQTSVPGGGAMVKIPAATILIGSDASDEFEWPVYRADVGAFEMDVTEVTVDAYRACVTKGSCKPPSIEEGCNWPKKGDHPMNCITWPEAHAYCAAVGKRLPTDHEWELAARGTDGRQYTWGNDPRGADEACISKSRDPRLPLTAYFSTCPAGTKPKDTSPYGVKDMQGNVHEYVDDIYCRRWEPFCRFDPAFGHVIRTGPLGRIRDHIHAWTIGFRCAR